MPARRHRPLPARPDRHLLQRRPRGLRRHDLPRPRCDGLATGLAVAREPLRQIAGWARVSTVDRAIIGFLENQGGIAGPIFGRFLQLGWSLITFLAVPVIALEGTGPFGTLKRSASLFRQRWGQQITGNVAIGGAVFLFGVLPAGILIVGGVLLWASPASSARSWS